MKLFTNIEIPKLSPAIDYSSKIAMFGSCFTDEIGGQLQSYGFNVLVNPFGTLYNPCSVFNSLMRLGAVCGMVRTQDSPFFQKEDIVRRPDGLLVTYSHHSRCGYRPDERDADPDVTFLSRINSELKRQAEFFYSADTLIITLGTSYIFKLSGTNFVVSNCHKMPARCFSREFLSLEESCEILDTIRETFPGKKIIFTVSPIRHLSDGAHGNQLSKSSLLLAVDKCISTSVGQSYYFPAYEIMMDELRDYRWYAEDLVHPSATAVKYIFEKFKEACISPDSYSRMEQEFRAFRANQHRPLL